MVRHALRNDLCCYFKIYRVRSPCANTRVPLSVRDVNNETVYYTLLYIRALRSKSDKLTTYQPHYTPAPPSLSLVSWSSIYNIIVITTAVDNYYLSMNKNGRKSTSHRFSDIYFIPMCVLTEKSL